MFKIRTKGIHASRTKGKYENNFSPGRDYQ